MTVDEFDQLLPDNTYNANWVESLNKFLPDYEINTPNRIAAFMAECAEESVNFGVLQENLNYRADTLRRTWPSHFPSEPIAQEYAHKPERIANRAYANRMGNGPEASGDGWKFSGKGLIQLTGKNNYEKFAETIGMNLDDVSEYLTTFDGAVHSACYYWKLNDLNNLADAGDIDNISRTINGGDNGLELRNEKYQSYIAILGAT